MRGLAALMVVVAHALNCAQYGSGYDHGIFAPFATIGAIGVDLFFVISGFVMALTIDSKPCSANAFMRDRLLRIVPLFWLLSAVYFLLLVPDLGRDARSVLLNSITIIPLFDGMIYHAPLLFVGWTLAFELVFYGLASLTLVRKLPEIDRTKHLMALVLAAAVTGMVWQPSWAAARILLNPMMLEFLFGVIVYRMWKSQDWQSLAPLMMIGGVSVLAIGIVNPFGISVPLNGEAAIFHNQVIERSLILGLPSGLIFAAVVLDRSQPRPGRRFFNYLGDASYSIYLTQVLVLDVINTKIAAGSLHNYSIIFLLITVSSVASGLIVHSIIERPMLAYFKKMRKRRTTSLPVALADQ